MADGDVTVNVGTVTANDSNGRYLDPGDSIWTDYVIHNRYERDGCRYMMGITSPGGFQGASVAFTQLASPTLLWICDWTASRISIKPIIPNPISQDPNWVLLDDWYEPCHEDLLPDGVSSVWRISGTYVYGHTNPNAIATMNINFPRPPWLDATSDRTVPNSSLQQNLSDISRGSPQPSVIPPPADLIKVG